MKDGRDGEDVKERKSWAGREDFKLLTKEVLARVGLINNPAATAKI